MLLFLALACAQQADGPGPPEQGTPSTSAPTIEAEPEPAQPDPSATAGASSESGRTMNPAPRVPTGPPPKLDRTTSTVELEKIIFDTFGSGGLPLTRATDRVIETLRDAIHPIYLPKYESAQGGDWLDDRDLVIGYDSESGAYAYPIKILNFHEIVNDVIDGVDVLVSYCPLCASAVVYDRELDGQILLFGNTSALYESDMVMYDHETGSYWFQVVGEAIVGPLTGKRLKMLPSMTVTWGQWKGLHPNTRVLSARLGLLGGSSGNPYLGDPFVGYGRMVTQGRFAFPVTEEKLDDRLPAGERFFAVEVDGSHKGYPLSGDSDWVLNDTVGGEGIVVVRRSVGPTASAFRSTLDGRELTFQLSDGVLEDVETLSRWNGAGLAVSGPMKGSRLDQVPSRTSFWFSLVASLPDVELWRPE